MPARAEEVQPEKHLAGICHAADFQRPPYSNWFVGAFSAYQPNTAVMDSLRRVESSGYRFRVFFGSWCGDSKREVPRLWKTLEQWGISSNAVQWVAVSREETMVKQSPTHEEQGLHVFHVPTIIVEREGRELNRIIEYPVLSLERDLLSIVEGNRYQPNHPAQAMVSRWLSGGLLSDTNISSSGLAAQIRPLVPSDGDLNACGNVLIAQGKPAEGLAVHKVNSELYPDHPRPWAGMARAYHRLGLRTPAVKYIRKAIQLNRDPDAYEALWKLEESIVVGPLTNAVVGKTSGTE